MKKIQSVAVFFATLLFVTFFFYGIATGKELFHPAIPIGSCIIAAAIPFLSVIKTIKL